MTICLANPEKNQDRVFDLFEMYEKCKQIMFHQQQSIYKHIQEEVSGRSVLEAGCGTGLGTAMLERSARLIRGTDKLQANIDFAKVVYPWIDFAVWDLNNPYPMRAAIVVCVEAVEHVANTLLALKHLLSSAEQDVWVSAPNGTGKPRPPNNPYHVCEYTPQEMFNMIGGYEVMIHRWDNWEAVDVNTTCDPLVYHVRK
jgi:2-polyprenyl-3-methyl-5-hydroxy-6-metoxy-1,4-benzoquinol methylase